MTSMIVDMQMGDQSPRVTMRSTSQQICDEWNRAHPRGPRITLTDLKGPRRDALTFQLRAQAMFRIRQEIGRSYPAIGAFFNRHHTTVIFAVRRWPQLVASSDGKSSKI